MEITEARELRQLLSSPKKIVITGHKNPDGDAVGSALGLYHYLKKNGHNARVIMPNDYPKFLKWMPGTKAVRIYEKAHRDCKKHIADADLIFALDYNNLSRADKMQEALEKAKADFVLIDHHLPEGNGQSDPFSKFTYVDPALPATAEMIWLFIARIMNDEALIDRGIATCLYTGIMTDTGSFRFPSTRPQTLRVAAQLIENGADNGAIHQKVYDTNSHNRLLLLGTALQNLKVVPEYRTAYITLSQAELDAYDFKKGDTEGFVNYALSLSNVIFAAIFIENKQEGIVKISFRSQGDFSVNAFARAHFEGGGHKNAAGGRSEDSLEKTVSRFRDLLPDELMIND